MPLWKPCHHTLMPLVGKNAKIVAGNCKMAKPKISGITPVELIFIGM